VYNIKDLAVSDLRILAAENSTKPERLEIYEKYKILHTHPITGESLYALYAEQDFFIYIEIAIKYLCDLFDNVKLKKYEKYFEPMTQGHRKLFDEINALFNV
jgi:hypothetical protein